MKKSSVGVYFNYCLNKLVLKKGKLSKADCLMNKLNLLLVKETRKNSMAVIEKSVENIMPVFLLDKKKIGKRIIIRPLFILSPFSRKLIGLKWIIDSARNKKGAFLNNFKNEIIEAFNNKGSLKKKQQDLNSIVLENRSNLKYRW